MINLITVWVEMASINKRLTNGKCRYGTFLTARLLYLTQVWNEEVEAWKDHEGDIAALEAWLNA